VKLGEGVVPENESDAPVGADLVPERAHGVDRVRGAGTAQLHVPGPEAGVALCRELDHAPSVVRGRDALGLLVRGDGRGDQTDLLQGLGLAHLLGRPQVSEMDRVEGAAQYADTADTALPIRRWHYPRTWPSPRTRYL
jgi:hypothetical protein